MNSSLAFLTPGEVAARWRCDVEVVSRLIKSGSLHAFSTSPAGAKQPRFRIPIASLEAYESGEMKPKPKPEVPRPGRRPKQASEIEFF
jgi:hypothetical protein